MCIRDRYHIDYTAIYFRRHDSNATPLNYHNRTTRINHANWALKETSQLEILLNTELSISTIQNKQFVKEYHDFTVHRFCLLYTSNIEIILVNDGTPDSSIELARKVAKNYSITLYVVNKENGGLPSARNVGIKAATGEYICFIDSDDMISTNHISDLVYACQKYRTKVAYADFQLTYEDNRCGMSTEHNVATSIVHDVLLQGFLVRKLKIHCLSLIHI